VESTLIFAPISAGRASPRLLSLLASGGFPNQLSGDRIVGEIGNRRLKMPARAEEPGKILGMKPHLLPDGFLLSQR
jgi:hypothetical protein